MKTIYISLLAALCITANAQFTMLSKWHAPDSSSTQTTRRYDTTTAIPKAMGANLTWDFGNMKKGSSTSSEIFTPASTGTDVAMYPTATIVGKNNGSTSYYSTGPATWELLGENDDKLTDSKILAKWPINFGSTWTDSYAGPTIFGPISGTITATASGHGTVIMPGGSIYYNCMQIHVQDMGTITGFGSGSSHHYVYYSQLQRFPLLTVTYNSSTTGTTTSQSANVTVNELVAQGINDNNFNSSYDIYPNPASDNFTVRLSNSNGDNCNVQIINVTGQVIKEIGLGNEAAIEEKVTIGDLSSGIYMVKTTLGDRSSTRRLVVQ